MRVQITAYALISCILSLDQPPCRPTLSTSLVQTNGASPSEVCISVPYHPPKPPTFSEGVTGVPVKATVEDLARKVEEAHELLYPEEAGRLHNPIFKTPNL